MDDTWIPEACTLPTAEQPLRVAEFDQLFADHLRHADRVDAHTLVLTLAPAARTPTADLIARESGCCSFFTFTLTGATTLRITVPPAYTAVLDGLTDRLPR
ncbi:hypothetical protein JOF29_008662 [Kribbella aluminosa]|uniref:Arsenate reductase n=1 Tax=Kribbella aluminosa TaxID=416017 RepID=A0ABS4V0X0_9ACTN|nr:hypothetical protein [Kribbella aluminosa]MBP2357552.1 hypothetical protein [Kribbella aluminosa]